MERMRAISFGLKHLLGYKVQGIGLILTRRCNLSCSYCRIIKEKKEECSVRDWRRIIERFEKNKHRHFIFTGGEPLLYQGVYELISHARRRSLTSLITNGTLLTDEVFRRLKGLDFLTFSYDSSGETHEKNTTSKLPLIARGCARNGITPSAIITITRKNVDEIPDMIRNLKPHNISCLLSLIHSDKGRYDFRGYVPELEFKTSEDQKRLAALASTLIRMRKQGHLIAEREEFMKNMVAFTQKRYAIRCPAGDPFLTIDTDGTIKACHDMPSSNVNALTFRDYGKMIAQVRKTVLPGCTCYYDCYFNSQYPLIGWHNIRRVGRCFTNITR